MKKLITLFALMLMAFMILPEQSKASHVAGADMTYEPVAGQPNQFLVRLKLYRDCNPSSATLGRTATICYSSSSCALNGTVTANELANSPTTVPSTICVNATPGNCSQVTSGNTTGDTEEHIYEVIVTLPAQCADWVFSWELCCRNAAITTLVNADAFGMYVQATLNNIVAPTNTSPVFKSVAFTRFCVGNAFNFEQGATDVDGDSLVFSLVPAEDAAGGCPLVPDSLEYVQGFSSTTPLSSSVPITIDRFTGNVFFVTTQVEVAIICVLVEEYRGGIKIGSIKRDIQVKVVSNCNPIIPAFPPTIIGGGTFTGGSQRVNCNEYTIILPLDTTYKIQCASAIPSDFRTLAPYGIPNPIVSVTPLNCINGLADTLVITFLNPLSNGVTRLWSKKGFDGNTFLGECGFELADSQDTVYLYVDTTIVTHLGTQIDSIGCIFNHFSVTLSDSVYCNSIAPDGSDFVLTDANGVVYPIGSAYGYCTPNGLKTNSVLINMQGNTSGQSPYYLTVSNSLLDGNTLADDCGRFLFVGDTLAIFYSNNKIDIYLGSDQTFCGAPSSPTVLDAGISGLQYTWYNQSGVISGAIQQTLPVTATGIYSVKVNNGPVCQGADTIQVTIITAPVDNLGSDLLQCANDPLPTLDAGNAGATYQWYFNGIAITNATNMTYVVPNATSGTYNVLVTTGGICQNSYDLVFNTFNTFPVNTLSNQSACKNSTYPTLDAGAPAAAIGLQWYNGTTPIAGQTGQFYTPTASGTYKVNVGTGACAATSSMVFTVVDFPVATLNNLTKCDYDQMQVLNPGSTTGATYQWYQNGSALPGETGSTLSPTAIQTGNSSTYSVDVTLAPGCTSTASMTYTINAAPVFNVLDTTICSDGTATLTADVADANYNWSNGASTQTITSTGGSYTITVTDNGCSTSDNVTVNVNYYPVAPVVACGAGTAGQFKFVYTWGVVSSAVNYEVSEDGGTTWVAANAPSGVESHGTNNTVSNFLVRAIGSGLCVTGAPSEPTACQVVIPNIITPNNDGKNDFLKIENIEQYANNSVQIFNRWGNEIYSQDGYNNTSVKFDGKDTPDGTYYVIVNLNQEGKAPISQSLTIAR